DGAGEFLDDFHPGGREDVGEHGRHDPSNPRSLQNDLFQGFDHQSPDQFIICEAVDEEREEIGFRLGLQANRTKLDPQIVWPVQKSGHGSGGFRERRRN
ncbi:MAG TPA: hypothetical protein VK464_14145, partial [Symbiobacteriaceae bacterium]|nr:hypothetical protein [Symbiobacteriaceae bacterium]